METYVVHVTKECNCDCLYCYETDKYSRYTWEEIRGYIDNIIKFRTEDTFQIEFLGGEPLLAWPLVRKAYEYIESIKEVRVPRYIITTNGTILNDEILDYLMKNKKFTYAVSMDGIKWANQLRVFKKSRKNTFDVAMKNLLLAKEKGLNHYVHFVTTPYNISFLHESVTFMHDNGIKDFGIGIVEATIEIDEHFVSKYIEQFKKITDDMVSGKLDVIITELEFLKSKDDVRTYLRDENGKLIGESYGRSGEDVTLKSNDYVIQRCTEEDIISNLVYKAKKETFDYHQKQIKLRG